MIIKLEFLSLSFSEANSKGKMIKGIIISITQNVERTIQSPTLM